jgi:Amt family ammonium transporter
VFGTLALGLFYDNQVATDIAALATGLSRGAQTWVQIKGIAFVGIFVFLISLVLWFVLKVSVGVRVSAEEESEGLDIGEHGNEAYPNFTTAHK